MGIIRRKLNSLVGRLTRRDWDQETIDKYVGHVDETYLTHSDDESLRDWSASGASVTAMILHWMESGVIDGALVCKTIVENKQARGQFYIATNREELLESRGSLYVAINFGHDGMRLINQFQGSLAVVALPCHVDVLRRRMRRDPEVKAKIKCIIALVCGHSSQPELVDGVTKELERDAGAPLAKYHFRHGHWRGRLFAEFENGRSIEQPFSQFSIYQNLYFWSEKKCFQCNDHFGYRADLSAGDVWSMHLRNNPIKHTCILVRTPAGQELFSSATGANAVHQETIKVEEVLDGQARTAPFHYNVTARVRAARRYRLKLKDTLNEKVHWNHCLTAEMAMFNWAWSQHPKYGKLVFKVPRPVLKAYLYLFKLLESF